MSEPWLENSYDINDYRKEVADHLKNLKKTISETCAHGNSRASNCHECDMEEESRQCNNCEKKLTLDNFEDNCPVCYRCRSIEAMEDQWKEEQMYGEDQ